jgi:hypothetical protein
MKITDNKNTEHGYRIKYIYLCKNNKIRCRTTYNTVIDYDKIVWYGVSITDKTYLKVQETVSILKEENILYKKYFIN